MQATAAGATTASPQSCGMSIARALFEQLAVQTESKIARAHQLHMRYGETTITDHNLLAISEANLPNVRVMHVPPNDERDRGYDWEWWIRFGSGSWTVIFAQGKKLHPGSFRYEALSHVVKGTRRRQIDLLREHARQFGGIPLYCFYNGPRPIVTEWNCHLSRDEQQFGCSVVPLHLVNTFLSRRRSRKAAKHSSKTHFEYLHENAYAIPWRCVLCASPLPEARPPWKTLADPTIEPRTYDDLPYYVRRAIEERHEYVPLQEYPRTEMYPRHIAVIEIEEPNPAVPVLPPSSDDDLLTSLAAAQIEAMKRKRQLA
jgi:hypothetical protein